ncbi:NAD(P)-dependent oxidoreductase [Blastococcus sp. SYSU D00820]
MVVLDPLADPAEVAAVLADAGLPLPVTAATAVPAGADVLAVLAGPETPVPAAALAGLPALRVLAATSTGCDHLPLAEAAARGIWVTRVREYCTEEVAEHTLALVLALLRSVPALDASVRAGRWDVSAAPPRRVAGSVLGLFGSGPIARAVAVRARALGMAVVVAARSEPRELVALGVRRVPPAELLATADVVSLHVPLTPDTEGMVDAAALAAMRPGSALVNVSRGAVVDSAALAAALRSGHLSGAAVDVLPVEPPAPGEPLLSAPNLLVTPHAAWYSAEAARRPARLAGAAVAAVLGGREPDGAVVRPGQS